MGGGGGVMWVTGGVMDDAGGRDAYQELLTEMKRYPIEQARRIWEAGKRTELGEPAGSVGQSEEASTPTTASR